MLLLKYRALPKSLVSTISPPRLKRGAVAGGHTVRWAVTADRAAKIRKIRRIFVPSEPVLGMNADSVSIV